MNLSGASQAIMRQHKRPTRLCGRYPMLHDRTGHPSTTHFQYAQVSPSLMDHLRSPHAGNKQVAPFERRRNCPLERHTSGGPANTRAALLLERTPSGKPAFEEGAPLPHLIPEKASWTECGWRDRQTEAGTRYARRGPRRQRTRSFGITRAGHAAKAHPALQRSSRLAPATATHNYGLTTGPGRMAGKAIPSSSS